VERQEPLSNEIFLGPAVTGETIFRKNDFGKKFDED
jgi:hypothetical protein